MTVSRHTAPRTHATISGYRYTNAHPKSHCWGKLANYLEYVSPFAVTKFPKPLTGTTNYYGLIRPYSIVSVIWPRRFCISAIATCAVPLTTLDRFSCSLNEPGYSSCRLYAGYRCNRYTGNLCTYPEWPSDNRFSVSISLLTTPHRSVYFRSASISIPDRFHPPMVNAFCLFTLAVQYQPLEREAPQGGLVSLPVKRIRETSSGLKCIHT